MSDTVVLETQPLGFPWVTADPFLFCAYHKDAYPAGNAAMGPDPGLLSGRQLGQDFAGKDGWNMYHGEKVPGFPQHPHRGFETVTIIRSGYVDHSDSLGATARFGPGDVQWLTAGEGIVHCEMFPLLKRDQPNPLELFQIWLNLPKDGKLVPPHFSMLWSKDIPRIREGRAEIAVIAGSLRDRRAPPPPPRSWAARPDSDVAIWTVKLAAGGAVTLPPAADTRTTRVVYFFRGSGLSVGGERFAEPAAIVVRSDRPVPLEAGGGRSAERDRGMAEPVDVLVLQGRPIGEPVVQYGPFVMNTRSEIEQAIRDYQRTRYGGWPWPDDAPVHAREETRFAKHADGRVERAEAT
jgi:redox-sensitive bicupin YhaK (pirin superfamily)